MPRKAIPLDVRKLVLHEAGYKCSNPACRGIITLDIHHLEYVSNGGGDTSDNLLALCPNCHSLHHAGQITDESVRAWKMLQISLNHNIDQQSIDLLLTLFAIDELYVTGDGLLRCSSLIASGLVKPYKISVTASGNDVVPDLIHYRLSLTLKGLAFVTGWRAGKQGNALGLAGAQ